MKIMALGSVLIWFCFLLRYYRVVIDRWIITPLRNAKYAHDKENEHYR
jgi:hypothetical protein